MIGLVLLAAGNSERFIKSATEFIENNPNFELEIYKEIGFSIKNQLKINKVFLKMGEKMIWQYSLEKFTKFTNKIKNIVFVLNPLTFEFHKKIIEEKINSDIKNVDFVEGGEKRQDSVFNALEILKDKYLDYIIIHDLARPLITEIDIKNLIESIEKFDGCTLYSLPDDSIASDYDNNITYLPRNKIYLIKTPQIFRKEAIINAHEELRKENLEMEFTDDISLLDFYLFKVGFVRGSKWNIKVTTFEDYLFMNKLVAGVGFEPTTFGL